MAASSRWRGLAVLCCLLGCSREGGLIVAVTRDPATTGPIDALTFYVGVSRTGGPPFLRDGAVPADVTLGGRDIADDPYRLLLHDRRGVDEPGSVVVAVLGQSGGQTVAFGGFDQPQAFMPDQLILRTVILDGA